LPHPALPPRSASVQAHIDALQKSFAGVRVDYSLLDTSQPLDFALFKYLNSRSRTMKIR
jgi:hypothetical protein